MEAMRIELRSKERVASREHTKPCFSSACVEPGPTTSYGTVLSPSETSTTCLSPTIPHRQRIVPASSHPIKNRHRTVPNPNLMGRGRVQLRQIENKISRQVTFSKRRTGLRKKAHEISVLCDAQVALIVFNAKGKLFEYSSESSMENVLERYERHAHIGQLVDGDESQGNWSLQCFKLAGKVEVLEKNLRNFGGEGLDPLSLRELQSLEHQLDAAIKRIRTKKAKELQEQNSMLTKKIKEKGKAVAERPHCVPETLGLACPPQLQPQQRLVPTLNLGETLQEAPLEEVIEARTAPSTTTLIPPWMLHHFTR
ncbi:Agamous-like MADS-box protein AGL8, partial [Mucuna pruriens]